jgi:hypothetical protein
MIMRKTFIRMCIAMCFVVACTYKFEDMSDHPRYKPLIGTQYEVIRPLEAYGMRDNSRAPVDSVTLIPPPGIGTSQVGFRVPVAIGSKVTIRRVIRTNRVFDPPMNLMVQLEGTQLPVHAPLVEIELFRGKEGDGDADLNPSIYRPLSAGTATPRSPSVMMKLIVIVVSVLALLAIVLYSTWLLAHRLRRGESKRKSFGEWFRNILQAIWGL